MATKLLVHAVTACVVVPNLIAQRIDVLISAQQQAMQPPLSSPPEMLEAEVPPVAPPASRTTRSSQKRPPRRKSWDGLGDDADVGSQPAGMPAQAAREVEPPAEADDPADGHGQAKKKFKCDADYLQKLKREMMYFCPGSTGEDSCQAASAGCRGPAERGGHDADVPLDAILRSIADQAQGEPAAGPPAVASHLLSPRAPPSPRDQVQMARCSEHSRGH